MSAAAPPRIPVLRESPFSRSALRILGLSGSEPVEALLARARALAGAPPAAPPPRPAGDLPWLPEVRQDAESLGQAAELLERPESRLRERLFWHHCRTDVDRRALEAVWAGRFEEADALWRDSWKDDQGGRTTAAHNLAVLYHSRALAAPRGEAAAARDLDQARRWWRHIVDGGRLAAVLLDGEELELRATGVVEKVEALVSAELKDLLAPGRSQGRHAAGSGHIPLFGGEWGALQATPEEHHQVRQGKMLAALEEAEEACRKGQRDVMEDAIERARDLVVGPGDGRLVEETWRRLATRLVMRGLKPLSDPPVVVAVSGLGTSLVGMERVDPATRSYETRLMFTVAHLPVLPLGRFRVRQKADGSPEFVGRLPMDGWMLIHALVTAGFLFVFLWGAVHLSRMSGHRLQHLVAPGGAAVTGPAALSPQEIRELEGSHPARVAKLRELDGVVRGLRAEREALQSTAIPDLRKQRDREILYGDAAGREARVAAVEFKIEQVRLRLKQIPDELRAVQEVRREIRDLDRMAP